MKTKTLIRKAMAIIMDKSRYTEAVNSLKAPEKAIEKMLNTANNYEKENVFTMKKIKNVIAAGLTAAVAIGGSIGIANLTKSNDNFFIIKAQAAELNTKSFTEYCKLNAVGGNFRDVEGKNGEKEAAVSEIFDFNIGCKGENISTITYKVNNGYFELDGVNEETNEIHDPLDKIISYEESDGETDNGSAFSSITVNYDNQLISNEHYSDVRLWSDELSSADESLSDKVRQAVRDHLNHANYKLGNETSEGYDDSKYSFMENNRIRYAAICNRLSVDTTVKYKDGTSETKTIIFKCESVDKGGVTTIGAKIK